VGNPDKVSVVLAVLLAAGLAACSMPPPVTQGFADDRDSMLYKDLAYPVGASGMVIVVPAGFVTDFASTPWFLWTGLPPRGQYSKAAIVHDYLYWTQDCSPAQADNIFSIAMQESNVDGAERFVIFQGVRMFGEKAWEENRKLRAAGFIKVVPQAYREFPDQITWTKYQHELRKKNIKETFPVQPAGYCKLGDSADVPTKKGVALK
jgi:hypothetical protein